MTGSGSEGYVTEVDYTRSFITAMAPRWLSFVTNILGFAAPPTEGRFRYLELGCGRGLTTNLIAACHPEAELVANDFNTRHIEEARGLANAAGLSNVTFLPLSFEELLQEEIGEFDFIGLHGVLSWVSPENQAFIRRTLNERLRPGGLVYVGYNCEPGWAAVAPLRRFFNEEAARREGTLDERIEATMRFARRFHGGMGYLAQAPVAALRLDESVRRGRSYIAHEFFSRDWQPRYHLDVSRELAEANLVYVGTTSLLRNTDLVIPDEIMPAFQEIEDPAWKEQVRDYVLNRQFRADVYARAPRPLSPTQHDAWKAKTKLSLGMRREDFDFAIRVPPVELALDRAIHEKLFDLLREGPLSSEEIAERSNGSVTPDDVYEACFTSDLLRPATTNPGALRERCERFNRAVADEALSGEDVQALASPILGSGVPLTTGEVLAISAMGEGGSEDAMQRRYLASLERAKRAGSETFATHLGKRAFWTSLGLLPSIG